MVKNVSTSSAASHHCLVMLLWSNMIGKKFVNKNKCMNLNYEISTTLYPVTYLCEKAIIIGIHNSLQNSAKNTKKL